MAIKDVIKHIAKTHKYKITSEYWGRIGAMRKKYGEKVLIEAISLKQPDEIPLTHLLNIVERKCQYILSNGSGEIDEFINEILNK